MTIATRKHRATGHATGREVNNVYMGTIRYIYKYRTEWNCSKPYQDAQERDTWLALDRSSGHKIRQTSPTDYTVYIDY